MWSSVSDFPSETVAGHQTGMPVRLGSRPPESCTQSDNSDRAGQERHGVEVIIVAAMLRDEERHSLVDSRLMQSDGALVEQHAAGIVDG